MNHRATERLFRVAAVAIVKDEADFLPEWLAYHVLLGCEHFFIFDNGSTDASHEVLERFINYGYVTRVDWPLFPGQVDAYNYAARVFGHLTEWLTFIDVDEFYVLKQHASLPECLDTVTADQLLVFWKTYGHSGHRTRPAGLVIDNFLRCEPGLSPVTKPIVRSDRIQAVQVHNCVTTSGATANDAGRALREDWMHPPDARTEELIRINHYFTRSYDDYVAKIERGQVDGRAEKQLEPFDEFDFTDEDRAAAARAPEVEEWLRRFEALPLQPHRYGAATAIGSLSQTRNFKLYAQEVIEGLVAEWPDAGAELDHFEFGMAATFADASVAPAVRSALRERLPGWAEATHGAVHATMADFEFRNGTAASAGECVEFHAEGEDPQIVAAVNATGAVGYHWLAALFELPEDAETDVFAFGVDPHGDELRETRRLELRKGLVLLLVMVNDMPLRLTTGRLDPGSAPGLYRVWDVALVRSQ